MRSLRPRTCAAVALLAATAAARADPTPEQLKGMYDETQRQLQQSQDRKNQLANENEQLKARVATLEAQLQSIAFQARQAQYLRNQAVVWLGFMRQYPALLRRFETYVNGSSVPSTAGTAVAVEPFFDPQWPFSAASATIDAAMQ